MRAISVDSRSTLRIWGLAFGSLSNLSLRPAIEHLRLVQLASVESEC